MEEITDVELLSRLYSDFYDETLNRILLENLRIKPFDRDLYKRQNLPLFFSEKSNNYILRNVHFEYGIEIKQNENCYILIENCTFNKLTIDGKNDKPTFSEDIFKKDKTIEEISSLLESKNSKIKNLADPSCFDFDKTGNLTIYDSTIKSYFVITCCYLKIAKIFNVSAKSFAFNGNYSEILMIDNYIGFSEKLTIEDSSKIDLSKFVSKKPRVTIAENVIGKLEILRSKNIDLTLTNGLDIDPSKIKSKNKYIQLIGSIFIYNSEIYKGYFCSYTFKSDSEKYGSEMNFIDVLSIGETIFNGKFEINAELKNIYIYYSEFNFNSRISIIGNLTSNIKIVENLFHKEFILSFKANSSNKLAEGSIDDILLNDFEEIINLENCKFKTLQIDKISAKVLNLINPDVIELKILNFNQDIVIFINNLIFIDNNSALLEIRNSNLNNFKLLNTNLSKIAKIEISSSFFYGMKYSGVKWFDNEKLNFGIKNKSNLNRDVYRELKLMAENQGDRFQAIKFNRWLQDAIEGELNTSKRSWSEVFAQIKKWTNYKFRIKA